MGKKSLADESQKEREGGIEQEAVKDGRNEKVRRDPMSAIIDFSISF